MKLRTLLRYLKECIANGHEDSWLCVADDDGDEYCISDFEEDDDGDVILYIGSTSDYSIEDWPQELEDFSPNGDVYVQFDDDTLYNIRGKYFYDDDDDVCFRMQGEVKFSESKPTYFEEASRPENREKYIDEFKETGDEGVMSAISRFASRLGIRTVYMALWLYYALQVAPITSKATIIMALGYLAAPMDLIADIIPFAGMTDDAAVLAAAFAAISKVISDVDAKGVSEKAKAKLKTIFPDFDDSDLDL